MTVFWSKGAVLFHKCLFGLGVGGEWVPAPQSNCPDSMHRAEFLASPSPTAILGNLRILVGGLIYFLPPQSLDLHSSGSLHLLCTLAIYSHGHTTGHALVITWISFTLTSELRLFSDHPSHLSFSLGLSHGIYSLSMSTFLNR